MLTIVSIAIRAAWKIIICSVLISLFLRLIKNGKDTLNDLVDTLAFGLKVGTRKAQKWLYTKWKKEETKEEGS